MISWIIWAVVLLFQNASFTLVSRARNSKSITFHAYAALCSNGVYFAGLGLSMNKLFDAIAVFNIGRPETWPLMIFTATFYTVFTMIGSVGMHYISMTKIEKGSRVVG